MSTFFSWDGRSVRYAKQTAALCFTFAVLFFSASKEMRAQSTTASLAGTIRDSSGEVVPEAHVSAMNTATGLKQETAADSVGAFLFTRLPVGQYSLTVEHAGFSRYVQQGIELNVNQSATIDVNLKVGTATEQVSVQADAEMVNTRTATTDQLIDQKKIVDLPLNGRTAQSLLFLAPGTVDVGRNGCAICGQGGVYPNEQTASVNGTTRTNVNYQLDGVSHNDTYLNASLPFPNPDSIQEFNLQSSNFSAEYGNAAGGVVNIVTRSGTNQIHGSAFEFVRNGAVNARNFFAPKPDTLKRNQYGGAVGGPILKNKLFYFATYQGTEIRQAPAGSVSYVLTQAQRNGDFSAVTKQLIDPVTGLSFAHNQIPTSRFSPVSTYLLNKWIPLPNGPNGQLTYSGTNNPQADNQVMGKVDYNVGKHQISGRYFFTNYTQTAVLPTSNVLSATNTGNHVRVQTVSLSDTYVASPNLLFNTTFGLNRQTGGSLSSAPFGWPDAGVNIAAPTPPELALSVTSGFSIATNHLGEFDRGDYTFREVVTKVIGKHELHAGGEALRVTNNLVNTYRMSGSFTFSGQLSGNGLADFLIGRASAFTQGGGQFKDLLGTQWSAFVQDNWHVSPRLTINIGLRWDPWIPYYDHQGRVACYVPGAHSVRYSNAPTGLLYGGDNADPGCPQGGSNKDWANLGPRFGFAYRITNDGKTSVRGGFGDYYTPLETTDFNIMASITPFAPTFTYNSVDFANPYGSVGVANPFPSQYGPKVPDSTVQFTKPASIQATFNRDFHIPTVYSWNIVLERQLGASWIARAAYVGNKGTYLSESIYRELNPAVYIAGKSTVANTQSRRPDQDFSNLGSAESGNNSHYEGIQLTVEKRFAHGFSVLANYTRSKNLDDLGWDDPYYRRFDYGPSANDIPNNFKFSNVWSIPRLNVHGILDRVANGWMLNGLMTWQSGFPLTITSGIDNSFSGVGRDHADFLGGNAVLTTDRSHGQMIAQWFDTTKFVTNAVGTFGNSGRGNLRGPRYFDTDLSAIKNTNVTEKISIQFRAEFFNLFNDVNFTLPNTNRSSSQFGQITSALDPRILQFGMKLQF